MKRFHISAIFALIFLMPCLASAYQVALEAKAEKPEVGKGETFTYTLNIIEEGEADKPSTLRPPDFTGFDVSAQTFRAVSKTIQGKSRNVLEYDFSISSDVPGEHVIPPARLVIKDPKTGRTETVESNTVKVVVGEKGRGVVKGLEEDIRDIKSPKTFLDRVRLFFYGMAAIVALVLIAIIGLAIYMVRRKKDAAPEAPAGPVRGPALTPRDEALAAISLAERLKDDPKAFYAAVTDTLRLYLRAAHGIGASELTSAETVSEVERLGFPESSTALLKLTLDEADLVKFAKYVPNEDEKNAFVGRARRLVKEI